MRYSTADRPRWHLDVRTASICGILLLVATGCGESIPQVEGIEVELTDANFESQVVDYDGLVLVDFGASWCGPCRSMEPAVAYLSVQYNGRAKVGKLDTDEAMETALEYEIESLPTFVIFRNGQEVARQSGTMSYRALSAWVDKHLGS